MNAPIKSLCDDCNKAQYPIYQVSYAHRDIKIYNAATGKARIVQGKQISKRVCSKCVKIYEQAMSHEKGVNNEVVL